MRHLEFRITAPFAGKKIEWFLRGDQGISHRVVIQLKKLPESRGEAWDAAAAGTLVKRVLPESYLAAYKNPPETH